ncbi:MULTISPECIES: hypothetical protein [Legionella]|uniref:PPM-type phosphatase domain-containing protein n=1 Tax=Legionella steelei TaxID=947033 RepID=A0A0W0ZES3_9GAMM|nr:MULTISPECIES: hypothetical protein [Legionella]KTD67219.1 hypothetical protein Lste_3425 [Legionella steelei]MBN9228242.1 hypothetical protein [Legionella steelei]
MSQLKIDGYNFSTEGDTKKRNGPSIGLAKMQGAFGEPPNMILMQHQEDDVSGEMMPGFNLLSEVEQEFALKETARLMQEKYGDKQAVGSTLTSLVAWKDPQTNQLHGVTSNVGDSLAIFVIVGADGQVRVAKQLNELHENNDRNATGIDIGVTRSIGDRAQEKNKLRHDPDITRDVIPLQEGDRIFAIAATDGISSYNKFFKTDALTTAEIAETVSQFIAQHPGSGPDDIAEALISRAYAGGKGSTDNISLVVAEVGTEPVSLVAADGHQVKMDAVNLGEKGDDVSKAIAENFHSQLQSQIKFKPQDYIDALREGNYPLAAGLGRFLYTKYMPLNDGEVLGADEVTPLMASLLAETDITSADIANIQHGVLSLPFGLESQYYMTQIMSGAITLLSNEAALMKQEGNQGKSAKDIRQMVRDEINVAITGPTYKEKNRAQEVIANITNAKSSKELEALLAKEMTIQKVFAFVVDHLIKENVGQIRAKGTRLIHHLNNIENHVAELNREADKLEAEIEVLKKDLENLYNKIGKLPKDDFMAQKKALDDNIALKKVHLRETIKLISIANGHKHMAEDQLLILCNKPEEFNNDHILHHLKGITNKRGEVSAKKALEGLPVEAFLQEVQQQIESYLDFLDKKPVENPDKNPRLLDAYHARKNAAENMLIFIKTASLRTPQETIINLQHQAKTIESNRPGIRELGFLGWLKDFFIFWKKSEMTKITDDTLKNVNSVLASKKTEFKEQPEKQVPEEPAPVEQTSSGPEPDEEDIELTTFKTHHNM